MNKKTDPTQSILLNFANNWQQENEEIKFDLFLQSRRVKQISSSLQQLSTKSKQEQLEWLSLNPDLVEQLMDTLLEDSMLALDGVTLDGESMNLSIELISDIRQTVGLVNSLMGFQDSVAN
ncbi:MAG: hypothetical protein GF381_03765 [Candidatus Pacebacteria bacterium]|nr:hypothetical protein [Candidatus Paceibacterota bacterium]